MIFIDNNSEANRRERIRTEFLRQGIYVLFSPAPEEDPHKTITEKLDQLLARNPESRFDLNKVWFTRSEAASYLSVSAKTIDRCRIKQDLPYYQVEGTATIRFKRKDLDKLMR